MLELSGAGELFALDGHNVTVVCAVLFGGCVEILPIYAMVCS